MTPTENGRFSRILKKINRAYSQMRIAHTGMYTKEFCNHRRWKKWKRVNDKWMTKRWSRKP